jgi:hypothetical protein
VNLLPVTFPGRGAPPLYPGSQTAGEVLIALRNMEARAESEASPR